MAKKMKPAYWFAARSSGYGWGWGLPLTWQGWAVFVGFFVLLVAGSVLVMPYGTGIYVAYVFVLVALLILICAKKGEPLGALLGQGRDRRPRL